MNPLQQHSDAELLHLLQQGGEKAFETIYRRYAADLYRYASRNIALKEDCEEIIQDLFTYLWLRRATLEIKSLRHYLFSAVRHKIIRYFEHRVVKNRYAEHYRYFEAVYDNLEDKGHDPEVIREQILKSIEQLPQRCQVAFKMRLMENLSGGEIAKRMNIGKRTVEHYMTMAYQHLRANLKLGSEG